MDGLQMEERTYVKLNIGATGATDDTHGSLDGQDLLLLGVHDGVVGLYTALSAGINTV